jgi:hypothetical protein
MLDQADVDRQRRLNRAQVEQAANAGKSPSAVFSAADLEWSFSGHESDLDELEQAAAKVQAEKRERLKAHRTSLDLKHMTMQVLSEWDAAERSERYAKAHTEAQRRLGES